MGNEWALWLRFQLVIKQFWFHFQLVIKTIYMCQLQVQQVFEYRNKFMWIFAGGHQRRIITNPHETARYGEIASAILNFFVCCMEMG